MREVCDGADEREICIHAEELIIWRGGVGGEEEGRSSREGAFRGRGGGARPASLIVGTLSEVGIGRDAESTWRGGVSGGEGLEEEER